jgi:hypothetical protein
MNWYDAMAWAASLEYESGGVIYDNWRLPTTLGTQEGAINEGEMSHLYYDENITGSSPYPFLNLIGDDHWTGTTQSEYADLAWNFHFGGGHQNNSQRNLSLLRSLAVMDGAPVPIPEPSTLLLLGSASLFGAAFRKKFWK